MTHVFELELQDSNRIERFDSIESFLGEDKSGQFGIQANHARLMTVLVTGLARFRQADKPWQYIALPGAVLYFNHNRLNLSTRRFLIDEDYSRISEMLQNQLLNEEKSLRSIRTSLRQMEEKMLKLMWEIDT